MIGGGYLAAGGLALAVMTGAAGYFHGLDTGRSRERLANLHGVEKANAARDTLRSTISASNATSRLRSRPLKRTCLSIHDMN